MNIILRPCARETELSDPAVTGQFAGEMAELAAQTHTPPWCGYIGWREGSPVGFGGFKDGLAEDGSVELGYLTFPAYEGTGVAKAVVAAMIGIARENRAVMVLAHTLCEENGSTGVLRANGFVRDGFGEDDDEGIVWRWRLQL